MSIDNEIPFEGTNDQQIIPIFPLPLVLFPGHPLPLHIFEKKYRKMLHDLKEDPRPIGIVLSRKDGHAQIGCMATWEMTLQEYNDGRTDILLLGTERFEVLEFIHDKDYLQARVRCIEEKEVPGEDLTLYRRKGLQTLWDLQKLLKAPEELEMVEEMPSIAISFLLASQDIFSLSEKQELLEFSDTSQRLYRGASIIQKQILQLVKLQEVQKIIGSEEDVRNILN